MSFAVVDDGGHLIALHRMDGADWISVEVAFGKAYTAAAFRTSSEAVAERGNHLPMFVNAITVMTHGRFTPQKGGLPIRLQTVVVGAIGASGGSGEQDVEVLTQALISTLSE